VHRLAKFLLRLSLAFPAIGLGLPAAYAALPLVPVCSWPVESTGHGLLNVATQDTNTTYWFMALDTKRWKTITITGQYPKARLFNITSYGATGLLIDTISDQEIVSDAGSTNPFTSQTIPPAGSPQNYTITLGPGAPGASNFLSVGQGPLVLLVYRVVAPNAGSDLAGGVKVPDLTLTARNGSTLRPPPCPFAAAETSLGGMITVLIASGFSQAADFLQSILTTAHQRASIAGSCTARQTGGPAAISFGPAPGTDFFPDPPTTYLQTPNICYQSGKVLVVHGKALVFPDTYSGETVSTPAFDGAVQVRYWSMCNNDGVFPYPVLACDADYQTQLDNGQSYTYVVSNDPNPPSWLPEKTNWLPWGPINVPITLIFRSITVPDAEPVPSDYYPTAVLCDRQVFIDHGWQGCFTAAGVKVATGP